MDKASDYQVKKTNYSPLIWILLALSLLATIAFALRAFVIQDYNGQDVTVYAYQLFSRNNTILNNPSFSLLRATLITGLLLGVTNICMSLWQGSYNNARRMKTLNSVRFSVTTLVLAGLIFAVDVVSNGNISTKSTFLGALGINCAIYFTAFLINLYYCSNKKLTIINYKAISVLLIVASSALWTISFLNIDEKTITGTQAILASITQQSTLEIMNNGTFLILSRLFAFVFFYNLVWSLLDTIANKSYRGHNIIRYLIGTAFSAYYAYFCIKVLGSTIQGSIGVLAFGLVYLILTIYTILVFKRLGHKIYSNTEEEMIYDENDNHYAKNSRTVKDIVITVPKSNPIAAIGREGLQDIDDYHSNQHRRPISSMPVSATKTLPKTVSQDNQHQKSSEGLLLITTDEYQKIERKDVGAQEENSKGDKVINTPIFLINNVAPQNERVMGDSFGYERTSTEYIKEDYIQQSKEKGKTKEINLDDIFISEKHVDKVVAPIPQKGVHNLKKHKKTHMSKLLKDAYEDYLILSPHKVLDNNNDNILSSYSDTNKALINDSITDDYINYSNSLPLENSIMVVTPPTKDKRFKVIDLAPSRIIPLKKDTFYISLPNNLKDEFYKIFMTDTLIYTKAPRYLAQGDNTLFFANIMKYIGLPIISIELVMTIYQFIEKIYERDITFISKCNKLMIDFLYPKSYDNFELLPIIKNLCNKEIRLMLSEDVYSTLPVIDRLIRVYIRLNNLPFAIKLCDTVIGFNLPSTTKNSFLRLREQALLLKAN